MFILIQRRGFFALQFRGLERYRIRVPALEASREKLLALDDSIVGFYTRHRASFLLSTGVFLGGWVVEALEVYVILRSLGEPVDMVKALSIDALTTFIKGGTFVVPGSTGAQEAGTLLRAYGYSDVRGMTFALLRRARELLWTGVGVLCLAFAMQAERLSERTKRF